MSRLGKNKLKLITKEQIGRKTLIQSCFSLFAANVVRVLFFFKEAFRTPIGYKGGKKEMEAGTE